MWYKIAKFGYIDVQKYIEEQLGYELNFKIEDYLKYILSNSSNIVGTTMTLDFDKLNTQLQNSPFNSIISRFGSIEEVSDDVDNPDTTFGAYIPGTKAMLVIHQFPKFALSKIVDVLMHEFAHALDPWIEKRPSKTYSKYNIMNFIPIIMNDIDKYRDSNGRILPREKIWDLLIGSIMKNQFGNRDIANIPDMEKRFLESEIKKTLSKDKESIIDNALAIIGNDIKNEESADEFVTKEYFNQRDETPAQLLSLHRNTLPEIVLNFCIQSLLGFLIQKKPNLLQILGVNEGTNPREILNKLKEMSPGFIDNNIKQNMIGIVRQELFSDLENSDILRDSKQFIFYARRENVRRQIYKILSDNFAEFKKLVDEL